MTNGVARKNFFGLLVEGIWNAIKTTRMIILAIVLVLSLAFNIAVVAVDAVAEVAEEVFEQLVGKPSTRAARLMLARQQVSGLSRTVAAQGRAISANAAGLQRALLDIQLRDRQMAALSKDLVRMRLSTPDLARERARATRLVRETSARISRRIAIDAGRNVFSMVGEAVPWFGIGVIAATTTIELKDACDSMRDLYDLEAAFDPAVADDTEANVVCGIKVPTAEELWAATKSTTSSTVEYISSFEMPELGIPFWE